MSRPTPFDAWTLCLEKEKPGVLATVLKPPSGSGLETGARLFVSEEGDLLGSLGASNLDRTVAEFAREKMRALYPKSETRSFGVRGEEKADIFVDVNVPPSELVIFGAGHDAIPVAKLACDLNFRTTVVDQRPAYATEERFPGTNIILARPEQLEEKIFLNRRTFTVIMNHHLERDRICLRFALESPACYVGVLGPTKRRRRLLDALREEGITFSEQQLSRIYNPIGLDIGAETSEEVAASIVAEILAVRNGHGGGFLRERGSIHRPVRDRI